MFPRLRLTGGLLAAAVVLASVPAHAQSMPAWWARYQAGDRAAVLAEIAAVPSFAPDVRRSREDAATWARRRPGDPDLARLSVATFLLDAAHARLETDWMTARPLIEVGCRLVEGVKTHLDLARRWHLSALALAQGAADTRLLLGERRIDRVEGFNHLAHSRARFPDEPRFHLAEVVVPEMGRTDLAPPRDRPWLPDEELAGLPFGGGMELAMRRERRAALARLVPLTARPGIGDEAHLRAAFLALQIGEDDLATRHLDAALSTTREPFIRYNAHLLSAMKHRATGNEALLERSLRQALEAAPRAQSATQLLVERLFLTGREDEAYRVAGESFDDPKRAVDPWRLFGYGDFRLLPALLEQLRAEVMR